MNDWLQILVGLAVLVGAAELLLRGAVWIALASGLTPQVVGLTLVAFGTSAPELIVSVQAAFDGTPGIALGNVLGSNIANIGLIVGCAALVRPIPVVWSGIRFESMFMLVLTIAVWLMLLPTATCERWHGALLLATTFAFTVLLLRQALSGSASVPDGPAPITDRSARGVLIHVIYTAIGLIGLPFGADWLVVGASGVAKTVGVSDQTIGLTVVAVGTSLPEMAASLTAARRGHPEIAMGNVLGSNVFNLGFVLGATALVHPLPMQWPETRTSFAAVVVFTVLLVALLRRRSRRLVGRRSGGFLLALYAAAMALEVALGGG